MDKELVRLIEEYVNRTYDIPKSIKGYNDEEVSKTVNQLIKTEFIHKCSVIKNLEISTGGIFKIDDLSGYRIESVRLAKEFY